MSVSEPQARLAVHSVEDLVGLVPYLIGFHPEESLVVMLLQEGRVAVTARVDLDAVATVAALDGHLARLFARFPGAEGWFLAYTDDDARAWQVLGDCARLVGLVHLGRVLQVGSERWRADCPDGPEATITGTVSAVAAHAAVLGLPARSSRRDLATALAGPPDTETDALVAEFDARAAELERLGSRARRRLLQRLLRGAGHLQAADCVRLALLADRPEGQLVALALVNRDTAAGHLQVWTQVVRRALIPYRPAVLGLLGVAAWQTGDGALQVVCLEEMDRIEPMSPLAALLDWLNVNVVPPEEWVELRDAVLSGIAADLRGGAADPPASRRGR